MNNIQEQRYIPEGYELSWDDQELGIQIYYKESPTIGGLCFVGRAIKPTWHYRFRNAEQRQAEVTKTFEWVSAHANRKAERKAKKAEATANHGVEVGDVFRSSWGYDQTNIDYYEVIAITGKTATFCAISQLTEETAFLSGECVPVQGSFIGKPFKKLIQKDSETSEARIKINSFSNAWKITPVAKVAGKAIFAKSHWTAYA
jgi:hypothetical protein